MTQAELVSGMQDEYQNWLALLDQIRPARMDQPGVAGHWSIKDIVAHLTGWRKRTLERLQAMARGEPEPPPPWDPQLQTDDEINDWIYRTHRDLSVRAVLDESDLVFQALLAAIASLPDEAMAALVEGNRYLWLEGRPIAASEFFSHFHEEHEPDMRAYLARIEQS